MLSLLYERYAESSCRDHASQHEYSENNHRGSLFVKHEPSQPSSCKRLNSCAIQSRQGQRQKSQQSLAVSFLQAMQQRFRKAHTYSVVTFSSFPLPLEAFHHHNEVLDGQSMVDVLNEPFTIDGARGENRLISKNLVSTQIMTPS